MSISSSLWRFRKATGTLIAFVAVTLSMLAHAVVGAPPASASCSSPFKDMYIKILTLRGFNVGPLDDQEKNYVQLLASNGIPKKPGATQCDYAVTAYPVLLGIASSRRTMDQTAADIMQQTGLNQAQAQLMMNSVFNAFGFPPTCDLCNDPWGGSPFPPPGR